MFHIRDFKNILIHSHKRNFKWILVIGFHMLNLVKFNVDLDTSCNWAQKHTWWILKSTKETSIFKKHNSKDDWNNGFIQNELS